MIIDGVDPRDVEWEIDQPAYRFWHQPSAPAGVPQERTGYACDEYRLTGDVYDFLDWARATARPQQTFTLYVEDLHDGRWGLIHPAVPT